MNKQIDVEIHYTLHLSEESFKNVLKEAEEHGYDFDDAGKIETVRRYLQGEGVSSVEELLEDLNEIHYTIHPAKKN